MKPQRTYTASNVRVCTDFKVKAFKYRYEVPESVLSDRFSHLDEETSEGFINYRGTWHHTSDFMLSAHDGWHGYSADSYSSGAVIWISNDGESYIIGYYCVCSAA